MSFTIFLFLFITNFNDVEDECHDGYTSDHKKAFFDVYGENWYAVYNYKWCDMTCGELAEAGYCETPWNDNGLYCSAGNLLVQDTCKHSCERCRKYPFFVI